MNYRTLFVPYEGMVLKLSVIQTQLLQVDDDGDLVQDNRVARAVAIQSAIGKAALKLAPVAIDSENCHVPNAACPVCGLSEQLAESPLQMALFDAVQEREADVDELRDALSTLEAPCPESRTLRLV